MRVNISYIVMRFLIAKALASERKVCIKIIKRGKPE